jgi:hypothetical protein
MFLQSRVGELIDSIVGLVASVINCLRDVLDVFVDLLFFCRCRLGVGTNEIDQWLNALNEKCCLVLEIILLELDDVVDAYVD